MAFTRNTLIKIAGAGGNAPSLWSYSTDDTAAQVDAADYFLAAADVLKVNDLIYAALDLDGTDAWGFCVVVSNTGTAVDCSNFTAIGAIDSD